MPTSTWMAIPLPTGRRRPRSDADHALDVVALAREHAFDLTLRRGSRPDAAWRTGWRRTGIAAGCPRRADGDCWRSLDDIVTSTMRIATIDQKRQFQESRPSKSCGFSAILSLECYGAELPLSFCAGRPICGRRAQTLWLAAWRERLVAGARPSGYSYSSPLVARVPPTMSTFPSSNNVAVWYCLATAMLPVAVNVQAAGSYSSALASHPLANPPATSTSPLPNNVAVWSAL